MGGSSRQQPAWVKKAEGVWLLIFIAFLECLSPYVHSAESSEQQHLIPAQATVVLLSGLPGDIESENAYREQLQDWLSLLEREKALKVVCLSDLSEQPKPPDNLEVKFLKATRANVQELTTTLSGTTNPILFVAWGHGGRQGSTPVFHVRGPRLTPSDFRGLKFTAAYSRWVLLFRGSGAFAAELAGADRTILASESGTMFNNDPISMPLLIKLVRQKPELSFVKLAEQLGQASAGWFAERNLVATEEPTLWEGEQKPRPLVSVQKENAFASEKTSTPQTSIPESKTNLNTSELPAAWKGITRENPSKFPGEDAVILRRQVRCTLATRPAISTEQNDFIQVLTVEGKRHGDFDIAYHPPYEEIQFLDCEVLRPDGKLTQLDPDAIREEQPESVGDYRTGRRKFFSLPGVVPGAILHVRHRTEWQTFPLPHVSMELPLNRDLAAAEIQMEVTVPRDAAFHFAFEKVVVSDPEIKHGAYGSTYSWKIQNVPGTVREPLAPPGLEPKLLLSTFPDWAAFASWYGRICKLTDEPTPEIKAKAAELTRECKTEREKVTAVYNYVTSLRYVAIPLGVNSFRPHAAANVLQNQFGDCKDKANLFNTLLQTLNIETHLVLLPRFSQAYDNLPGLAFNHAISQVFVDQKPFWVDTTDDVCRFGLLPPGDPGRKVLVIDGKSAALSQLPRPEFEEHGLKISGKIDCAKPAQQLPVLLEAQASGYCDYQLRNAAQENRQHSASFPLLAKVLHPVAGAFALDNQDSTRVSALEENFTCQTKGTWIGGHVVTGENCALRSPFWIPNQWNLSLHRRMTPLYLNEGYPLRLEEQFEVTLPPNSKLISIPKVSMSNAGPLRWKAEWSKIAEGKLTARLNVDLVAAELSVEESAQFQKQFAQFVSALNTSATFSTPQ